MRCGPLWNRCFRSGGAQGWGARQVDDRAVCTAVVYVLIIMRKPQSLIHRLSHPCHRRDLPKYLGKLPT